MSTMTLNSEAKKQLRDIIGNTLPNGVIINHVIGWLDAADDNLTKVDLVRIMCRSYSDEEISEAREVMKDLIKLNKETFKDDRDLDKLMGNRKQPEKRERESSDIVDFMSKLDEKNKLPTILVFSQDLKRNPESLQNPEDSIEHVSHKVKMLESCILNLADKVSEGQRVLKEEIRQIKPSYADLIKNREAGPSQQAPVVQSAGVNLRQNLQRGRSPKRTRTDEGPMEVFEEVDGFRTQQQRGFLGGGQKDRSQEHQQRRDSSGGKPNWRNSLPNVTGEGSDKQFAAPVDLFVFNVNKDISEDNIVTYMKDEKNLVITECQKVSHKDARTARFKIKINGADYDKAMMAESWPYRVRVRVYRHFKQRGEASGQFSSQGSSDRSGTNTTA